MTKADLLKAISADAGESAATVDAVLTSLANVTSKALGEGEDVTIPGLLKLDTKERAARKGRNPKTGEEIDIAAKTVVSVKVLKGLADHVA
ncbi:DNA-binding protein HU-beta [Candidatus Rhodobacter oscarellae]|uniref:Viral histone-like protein n=2 Tax=Rhodobacterales TaxID=204455 RepID=A0A0J9EGH1_9RHOB|nr:MULTISPECIES: HU family DNA-binding protein [Rhodobacterales]KMW60764.1 DNA-binding protein HU-beta [Candidatus Rhodobacter lobularis]SDG18150.1 DNA-binding protein HU-beta [Sulfitobacter delicatus]